MSSTKTIFALSSGALPSAIAVIRMSGAASLPVLRSLTRRREVRPRELFYSRLHDRQGDVIDRAMAVFLPGPSTFTGEDSSEFFVHGSRAVVDALSRRLCEFPEVKVLERNAARTRLVHRGLQVVLVGKTNAGKSSILNRLAAKDVAIVSSIAGTTRDAIEANIQIAGVPLTIVDTAGVRSTKDEIEAEGIRRTMNRLEDADVAVLVVDSSTSDWKRELAELRSRVPDDCPVVTALNKSDLNEELKPPSEEGVARTCAIREGGVDSLVEALRTVVTRLCGTEDDEDNGWGEAERLRRVLDDLEEALDIASRAAIRESGGGSGEVVDVALLAEYVQAAADEFSLLDGSKISEELLDRIFEKFCIGK